MRGREPGGFDVILVPELQETVNADGCAEDAARDVGGIGGRAVARVDPGFRGLDGDALRGSRRRGLGRVEAHQPETASISMP